MGLIGLYEIVFILIIFIWISLIPMIFFLLSVQNLLREVSMENRKMQPEMVWLSLIPLFGLVWQFIIVNNVADSLRAEFAMRNINVGEERPGIGIGLAYCILYCCCIVPFLGFFTAIAGFICWIIYWVKIGDFKMRLMQTKLK